MSLFSINTAASARWDQIPSAGKLFQQFPGLSTLNRFSTMVGALTQ
jgi:hypothetical protein